ncbi:organomercurial lyase [Flavobacterium chilense]|uniref:Alkylmercury lyase n=1 Tax=Flavobacterium chilense TaxID=946677 RepID=A0A1M7MDV0_9FLAO|nr:organomercurial lyase [Flavobacterium chilense]SHM89016.1 alkylmercury lyase [Flavobacterium chilense]
MKQYLDKQLTAMLAEFDVENTNFIIDIHNELLKGNPIAKNKFYELVNFNIEKANAILNVLGEFNKNDEITAFSGLSLTPTSHKFIVGNKTLYTWCALDAILFTEWLDVSSKIISQDPIDNSLIELNIDCDHLISSNPYPIFISWVEKTDSCNLRGSFCNHVSFFSSEATAKRWLKNNPNGKILTLDDLFESNKIGIVCC